MTALAAITTAPDIRALDATARKAGNEFAVHVRECRACRAGLICLTRRQLDTVANRAEDRLEAALERMP